MTNYPKLHYVNTINEIDSYTLEKKINHDGTQVVVTDFSLTDVSNAVEVLADNTLVGWKYPNNIWLVDHHVNDNRMRRQVSATNLAIKLIKSNNHEFNPQKIIINHTDADSIMSAMILAGYLEPDEEKFGKAAIAADHTGEENIIADTLMAVQYLHDIDYSADCLFKIIRNIPLSDYTNSLILVRHKERALAKTIVEKHGFIVYPQDVAYIESTQSISGEFFPPLFPNAKAIVIASPLDSDISRWEVRVRAGKQFPLLANLLNSGIEQYSWGGRWNGGNTKRKGGYQGDPKVFAQTLSTYFSNLNTT